MSQKSHPTWKKNVSGLSFKKRDDFLIPSLCRELKWHNRKFHLIFFGARKKSHFLTPYDYISFSLSPSTAPEENLSPCPTTLKDGNRDFFTRYPTEKKIPSHLTFFFLFPYFFFTEHITFIWRRKRERKRIVYVSWRWIFVDVAISFFVWVGSTVRKILLEKVAFYLILHLFSLLIPKIFFVSSWASPYLQKI